MTNPSLYFLPPDGYSPPTHCETCERRIMYVPVIGGHAWTHVVKPEEWHPVVMRVAGWWETRTGVTRYGTFVQLAKS